MKSKISTFLIAFIFLTQFAFSQTIETVGLGVYNLATSTLTFTDPGSIDHVVVEAIYKDNAGGNGGVPSSGPVTFSDVDESYDANSVPVEFLFTNPPNNDYGSFTSYFQATFNTVDDGGITLNQGTNLGKIHSFIAYVYRNIQTGFVSTINMDHGLFIWNGPNHPGVFTFPLNQVTDPRELRVTIPLSEMSPLPSTRPAIFTVSAGGVSETVTVIGFDPAFGQALNLEHVTLSNVPGAATELTVSMYSPNVPYASGDSWITGGIVLDVETEIPPIIDLSLVKTVDNPTPEIGSNVTFTIVVTNDGPDDATGVTVTDELPTGYTYVSDDAAGAYAGNIWTIGDLAVGASVTLNITAMVNATGDYFNVAQVTTANETDIDSTPNNDDGDQSEDDEDNAVTIPVQGDCGPCDGQMTSLTLQYLGNETVTIRVYSNKVQPDKLIGIFEDVEQGDEIYFVGTNNQNKLGAKVRITIDGVSGYTEIHTSCSQPIEVGMIYGNFLLTAGTSHEGGDLCPGSGGGGGDCGPCEGQMTSLTLEYQGYEVDATVNVYSQKVQNDKLIETFYNVNHGDIISFVGNNNQNKLGSKVRITIDGISGYTEIHTSCSQPIEVGMTFGDFLLTAGTSHEGGDLCPDGGGNGGGDDCGECDGQMTSLTLEYQGNNNNATIKVYKDKVKNSNLIATFNDVDPGDEFSFVGTGNGNKLGAKVRLTVNNNNCNYTEIHTSCSQPIEVGMVWDDKFELIAGTSHDGGDLCDDGFKSSIYVYTDLTTASTYITAYPNPMVSGSTIEFEVADQGNTVVELINIQGQVVKQIFNGATEPGSKYSVLLNASDLNTGIYLLKMTNGTEVMNQKISIVR